MLNTKRLVLYKVACSYAHLTPDMSAELRPGDASGIARKASIEKFRDLSLLTELDAKIRRLLLRKS